MVEKDIVVNIDGGLQSKTAAVFIQKASSYKCSVWVEKDERKANAKSLLGLLSLVIDKGDRIKVITEGSDEEAAANELEKYLTLK